MPYTLGGMCTAITCNRCNRPAWVGCGAHVEQVLGHVPKAERCQCDGANPQSKPKRWFSR